jgi:hypothetical protein
VELLATVDAVEPLTVVSELSPLLLLAHDAPTSERTAATSALATMDFPGAFIEISDQLVLWGEVTVRQSHGLATRFHRTRRGRSAYFKAKWNWAGFAASRDSVTRLGVTTHGVVDHRVVV